jgi:hypothetical protein
MPWWAEGLVAIVVASMASTGFWAFVQGRTAKKSAVSRLLLGLAYDKITNLGMKYIDRGWITKDEYEDFRRYLYEPYKEFGGNGVGDRIMLAVSNLPLRSITIYPEVVVEPKNKE